MIVEKQGGVSGRCEAQKCISDNKYVEKIKETMKIDALT